MSMSPRDVDVHPLVAAVCHLLPQLFTALATAGGTVATAWVAHVSLCKSLGVQPYLPVYGQSMCSCIAGLCMCSNSTAPVLPQNSAHAACAAAGIHWSRQVLGCVSAQEQCHAKAEQE